jgi:hypothetical protein
VTGAAVQWILLGQEPTAVESRPVATPSAPASPAPPPTLASAGPAISVQSAPEPLLTAEQARRLAGYAPGKQPLLAERLAATREMLERADDERYAIELFVTENTDPARMERFLLRARELVPLDELYVIPVAGGGQYRLWVVYGDFASREEATAAGRRLPPRYQQVFRTAPRSFGELRRRL